MESKSNKSGRSFGMYIADEAVVDALEVAAKVNGGTSKYCAVAVIERLTADGFLPQCEDEKTLLDMIREARESGIDVRAVFAREVEKINRMGVAG